MRTPSAGSARRNPVPRFGRPSRRLDPPARRRPECVNGSTRRSPWWPRRSARTSCPAGASPAGIRGGSRRGAARGRSRGRGTVPIACPRDLGRSGRLPGCRCGMHHDTRASRGGRRRNRRSRASWSGDLTTKGNPEGAAAGSSAAHGAGTERPLDRGLSRSATGAGPKAVAFPPPGGGHWARPCEGERRHRATALRTPPYLAVRSRPSRKRGGLAAQLSVPAVGNALCRGPGASPGCTVEGLASAASRCRVPVGSRATRHAVPAAGRADAREGRGAESVAVVAGRPSSVSADPMPLRAAGG